VRPFADSDIIDVRRGYKEIRSKLAFRGNFHQFGLSGCGPRGCRAVISSLLRNDKAGDNTSEAEHSNGSPDRGNQV
jgi:hypothetical protein